MSESSSDRFRQRSDYVRSPITDLVQSTVAERPRKHFSACKRCHARKIKCSGDRPCTGCQATDHPQSSCVYPARDRKIKISQSYIQRLVEENNDLRQSVLSTHGSPTAITSPRQPDLPEETYDQDANVRKALIDDRAWFVPYSTASAPVYIEEASCTAFATRFRQSLDPSTGSHRLRASYVKDADLVSTADLNAPWPARTQARLLVKVALAHIGQSYHLTLAKATLNRLDRVYEDSNFNDPTSACKFFGLFALGEVYSNTAPSHSNDRAHGLMFFRKASSLVQVFPERPTIDHIENFILLALFSSTMNRRNTARCWIGLAFHLSLTLGLHHNVSDTIPIDPVTRQHRIRIWWTMYTCDRMWGAKTGYPVSIQDEDISVDYPSLAGLNDLQAEEFSPSTAYVTASIRLARIAGSIVSKIYSRRKQGPSFVQSVQQILNDLKVWVASLPESLKLDEKGIGSGRPRNIISLHLAFNQCVILSTRPVLLYVFKQSSRIPGAYIGSSNAKVSPITAALGEACLHTARHSNSILTQCWIEGSLTLFGYLDAQYLFSSAIVLAISSMFGATTQIQDIHGFETAAHILLSMSKSGNLAARDFSEHLEQVKKEMDRYHTRGMNTSEEDEMNMSMSSRDLAHEAMDSQIRTLPQIFTTEMALLEQPMQDFLAQPLMSGVFPNPLESFNDMPLLYSGPLDWVVSQGISQ